jgi:hypothetical protein
MTTLNIHNVPVLESGRGHNVAEGSIKILNSVTNLLVLFFLVITLVPFSNISLYFIVRRIRKSVPLIKAGVGKLPFEEIKQDYEESKTAITSLSELLEFIGENKNSFLFKGIYKKTLSMYNSLLEVNEAYRSVLYVDATKIELSADLQEQMNTLKDFFGDDEEYEQDTHIQLKKVGG